MKLKLNTLPLTRKVHTRSLTSLRLMTLSRILLLTMKPVPERPSPVASSAVEGVVIRVQSPLPFPSSFLHSHYVHSVLFLLAYDFFQFASFIHCPNVPGFKSKIVVRFRLPLSVAINSFVPRL